VEALFAVQQLREVGAKHGEEFEGLLGIHHFQAKQVGRRHRRRGIAGGLRRGVVVVDRIGLAERLAKKPQSPGLDVGGDRREASPDGRMVDHVASSGAFVEGDDAGAAETEIVLQSTAGAVDLRGFGGAAQLARQLVALRKAGGAERVALG